MRVPIGRLVAPASSAARSRCSIAACRSAPRIRAHPSARCALAAAELAVWPISSASARACLARRSARSTSPSASSMSERYARARMLVARWRAPGSVRASSSGTRASSRRPARKSACPSGTRPAYRHSLPAGSFSSTNLAACSASAMPRLRYVELTIATAERSDVIRWRGGLSPARPLRRGAIARPRRVLARSVARPGRASSRAHGRARASGQESESNQRLSVCIRPADSNGTATCITSALARPRSLAGDRVVDRVFDVSVILEPERRPGV